MISGRNAGILHRKPVGRRRWLFFALLVAVALQLLCVFLFIGRESESSDHANKGGAGFALDLFAKVAAAGPPKDVQNHDRLDDHVGTMNKMTPTPPLTAGRVWEPPDLNAGFHSDPNLPLLGIVTLNSERTIVLDKRLESMKWMYPMSYNNKKEYCEKWGYDLIIEDSTIVDKTRDVRWGKIPTLLKWLPRYQWLLWMDLDTFIMRFDLPLHNFLDNDVDMIASRDWNGLNSGVFFIRNSPYSSDMLHQVWSTPEKFLHRFNDQAGFNAILHPLQNKQSSVHREHFRFLPQREINAFPEGFANSSDIKTENLSLYQPGDRIVHFPGCSFQPSCRSTVELFYRQMLQMAGIDDIDNSSVERVVRPPGHNRSIDMHEDVQFNGKLDVWKQQDTFARIKFSQLEHKAHFRVNNQGGKVKTTRGVLSKR